MKKLFYFSSIIAIIALFSSCGEVELPNKFFEINGESYSLEVGQMIDYGTNYDITYRTYDLGFASSSSTPKNYISFYLYSNSTTRIEEGTYSYEYIGSKGSITDVNVGINLTYDGSGEAISGTRFSDYTSTFEGTVTISKKNDNYSFVFDLTITDDDETYTITGEYNDVLSESYFSY